MVFIGPDRQMNPHAYEVAYQYQNIWAKMVNAETGEVSVHNENFFRDLSNYALAWSLEEDGVETQNGTIADLDVPAQQTELHHPLRQEQDQGQGGIPQHRLPSEGG